MQSKITIPLLLGILGTIVFNLSPIIFGYGLAMDTFFLAYAGLMFAL